MIRTTLCLDIIPADADDHIAWPCSITVAAEASRIQKTDAVNLCIGIDVCMAEADDVAAVCFSGNSEVLKAAVQFMIAMGQIYPVAADGNDHLIRMTARHVSVSLHSTPSVQKKGRYLGITAMQEIIKIRILLLQIKKCLGIAMVVACTEDTDF